MFEEQIRACWPGWEIVREIGQGSFGSVYEIRRDLYGRIESAALKVISIPQSMQEVNELRSEGYDDRSITAHFQGYLEEIIREYTVMLDLKGHTNVVYCDDVRYVPRADGFGWDVFIKMELLTPLTSALYNEYDEAQVIRMGIDLCNALILCKNENIIHRDIKPQNIFVSRTGDCKLGDFGVAKISDKTVSGTKIGTYKYMAPEVYLNRPYGTSSDLYSLGLVLYWAMNERRTPFLPLPPQIPRPAEEEEARQRRFSGEPIPAPIHGSRGLQEIVLKACAYDPGDRFRDPAQMREALIRLSSGAQPRYDREPAEEGTVGVFGTRTAPVREKQPEEGTVGVFGNQPRPQPEQPVREDGTVGVFGNVPRQPEPAKEDPTAGVQPRQEEKPGKTLSMEELSELMSPYFGGKVFFGTEGNKKPEPVKTPPMPEKKPVQTRKEPPKNKKKIIGIAIAAAVVLAVLLIVILSTTVPSPSQNMDQSVEPGSASQQDGEAWEGNILANFTENLDSVTKDSPAFGNEAIPRGEVVAVFFLDSLKTLDEYGLNDCWDVSRKQDGSVMAGAMQFLDGTYQLYIAADGGINGSIACKGLFQSFTGLEAVSFEKAFHTDYTTDMSNMFYGCNNLILVDCENLVTSNVTTMENMFNCCTDLISVDVFGFDTSKVKNMSFMFHLCISLAEEVIESAFASWDVSAVTDYEGFADSSSYTGDYLEFFEAVA